MDDGGGNGGGSFRVKHGSDAAEVLGTGGCRTSYTREPR